MRILFFNCGGIGDSILGTLALAGVRRACGNSWILTVVSGREQALLTDATHLSDRVVILPTGSVRQHDDRSIPVFLREVIASRFDLGLQTYPSRGFWNSFLLWVGRVHERAGFRELKSIPWLSRTIEPAGGRHVADYNHELLASLGMTQAEKYPETHIPEWIQREVSNWQVQNQLENAPFLVVHGGAGHYGIAKRMDRQKMASIIDRMRDLFPDHGIVQFGHDDAVPEVGPVTPASWSILHSAVLLGDAEICISSDSGPMHLAAMMHTPVLGLFGPTDPAHTGPLGAMAATLKVRRDCAPCLGYRDTGRRMDYLAPCDCMNRLSVDEVVNEVLKLRRQAARSSENRKISAS